MKAKQLEAVAQHRSAALRFKGHQQARQVCQADHLGNLPKLRLVNVDPFQVYPIAT